MTRGKYANIIINISNEKVAELQTIGGTFGKLEEGTCVQVPSKGGSSRQGYVVEVTDRRDFWRKS